MIEPEYIKILEGPTPDFRSMSSLALYSIHEGPSPNRVAFCELRAGRNNTIIERCRDAWREGRPVILEYPDRMRMRQEADVVALRMREVTEGLVLMLWLRWPLNQVPQEVENDEE